MNRRQGQPGDSIEACDGVVSACRPVENRGPEGVLLCEHIFYSPNVRQSIFSRGGKAEGREKKPPLQETERRVKSTGARQRTTEETAQTYPLGT